jgi:glycosyltransferase involved in cell wall biosynthesis
MIFYSVDFNRQRFKNKLLQWIYEKADKVSSINSDQIWVVCESLKKYKSNHYFRVNPTYIPNSSIFDFSIYKKNYQKKNGNRLVWTGSLLTEKQFDILFGLLKEISKLRPEMEFYFAPTGQKDKFRNSIKKYQLKNSLVVYLHSRREWQDLQPVAIWVLPFMIRLWFD